MKKWQILTITALAVLILAGAALLHWLRPYDLATEQAAARRAGLALMAAQMGRPHPPPGQDAYPFWVAMEPVLRTSPRVDALVQAMDRNSGPDGRLNPAGVAAGRELAETTPEVAARIRRATTREAMYWPHSFDPPGVDLDLAGTMRQAALYLARRTRWLGAEGRYDEVEDAAAESLVVAEQAAAGATVVNNLVGMAVDAITVDSLEKTLRQAGPNAEAARAVRAVLTRHPPAYDTAEALRGETLLGLSVLDASPRSIRSHPKSSAGGPASSLAPAGRRVARPLRLWTLLPASLLTRPRQAAYLHWMTRMVEAASKPEPVRVAAMERVAAEINALPSNNPTLIYPRSLIPVFSKMAARGQEEDARRAVLLSAAEALEYRAVHGAYPARLTDAAAKPPMDPYTGKPVLYARAYAHAGAGFAVWTGAKPSQLGSRSSRRGLEFRYP